MTNYFCNPINIDYRYQYYKNNTNAFNSLYKRFREAADPTLINFNGEYYLFLSMTAGFYSSSDLKSWKFYPYQGDIPIYNYAPDVCEINGYLYFSSSEMTEPTIFYRSKDPKTEPFEPVGGSFPIWDSHLFEDDDGRVYCYWGCSNQEPIYGVEMDIEKMEPRGDKIALIYSDINNNGFERFGENHIPPKTEEQISKSVEEMLVFVKQKYTDQEIEQDQTDDAIREMLRGYLGNSPYIEGAWMTKHERKYYLQYAIPGTQYNIYGDAVYVGLHPLGPFTKAKNNPYSYFPTGFITGAGHGSTLKDNANRFWHTSTMRISQNGEFERRIGMWHAGFDQDGELFCDQRFGDWPIRFGANPFEGPDMLLLSYKKTVTASSGIGIENIVNEDIRNYWEAASNAEGEWIEIDLGQIQTVQGIQINFADDDFEYHLDTGLCPIEKGSDAERYLDTQKEVIQWRLEGSLDGETFEVIKDKWDANTDLPHDFIELEWSSKYRFIRLTIRQVPYGVTPKISGLRIFGRGNGEQPAKASSIQAELKSPIDLHLSWQGETRANILWGHDRDKLYHSRLNFEGNDCQIGALTSEQAIYVRIDTFNEAGVTQGDVVKIR
ncbi:family 43 glycosylhydrolase [Streptococcus moroccensis]|uniref:F5/8 type C domain-containing protein n=1 Tax=Streptococcus moroccensis TaxID=1451356 RepID=A0ABT9YPY7_9STRE|nr:family 43 glycosylhydrolase [Streptococcus moroccensis]MDQ0221835.1 hypothetical protein [Streptococcus moroccensis]